MSLKHFQQMLLPIAFLIFFVSFVSCSPTPPETREIAPGDSKDEVLAALGEPETIQTFVLPDAPFSGPQEDLINLVPAGATVEEWTYEIQDEVLYIWFSGDEAARPEDWPVIGTARYPKGAVF